MQTKLTLRLEKGLIDLASEPLDLQSRGVEIKTKEYGENDGLV